MRQKTNGNASVLMKSATNNRWIKMYRFIIGLLLLQLICTVSSFAGSVSVYEIDGQKVGPYNKTRGPKAVVSVEHRVKDSNYQLDTLTISQDTILVSLKDSVHWLEMEKNTIYSVCVDDAHGGIWKAIGLNYREQNKNCIQLHSGNYVKSAKIQYATKMGNGYTFNLLIGMKYIDLRGEKHLLGLNGPEYKLKEQRIYWDIESQLNNRIYLDPARLESIDEVLAVDKYMVTECEFVQALWDSIPANPLDELLESQNFWIQKKKSMTKGGFCDAHDSAAIRIKPYLALVYANIRSLRDGLRPVYSFEESNGRKIELNEDGSFGIHKESFRDSYRDGHRYYVHVSVDKSANGYRLPYYNEWMALARGGEANYRYIWGNESDSVLASQYAWFGVRDPEDQYSKIKAENTSDSRFWLKYSCGRWLQKSRPVGMLKPNPYGLYDIVGLVCENVLLPGKSIFSDEVFSCKGGFLADSLESLNLGSHCDTGGARGGLRFQGLRLVRQIK